MINPVRVGIIGAGNVLWAYLQVMDRLIPRGHAVLGPVCARRADTWSGLRARRPSLELVKHPSEVLNADTDIVLIITSPATHAEFVRASLAQGKHVVVEKPIASTAAEAADLAKMAADKGVHLLCAPFVQLAPTFRAFWMKVRSGGIGCIHSTRGLYGNAGSTWASWYHNGEVGPLAEVGIYNLKSLTAIAGPVAEVLAAEARAVDRRRVGGHVISDPAADVVHVILRHASGVLSCVVSSHAIQRYRRPALEIYGTEGTANLLGDDWDPRGFEIWRNKAACWEEYEPIEPTWLWTDGLSELVMALREGRPPLAEIHHDVHLLEVIEACQHSVREKAAVQVRSSFRMVDLCLKERRDRHHLHDHTRPSSEQ